MCKYVYMYICIYVYMYICFFIYIYVYMCICIYVNTYICIYVYMYICIRGINLKIFTVMGGLLLFDPLKCVFVLLLNPTINFIACVGAVTLKKTTTATVHHPIYSNHHVF